MDFVVAVDVGGTTIKGGLVARDGTILHFERRDTPRGADRVIAAISAFVADLARPRPGLRQVGVGLAMPGLVTPTHAVFSAAFGWRDVPVASFADVDLPVALGHDVRSAGEAEQAYGAGGDDVLFLPIGTAGDALLVPLRERLAARLAFRRAPEVVASTLGVDAGLLGAALLGWRSAA
ncbi:ROK family protein [Nonomuraea helvata]|uniref:ROK family protein n=1 Tax=Nonomuraea helvata TaxID=37484 RepID=A0ABV5SJM6_9ACTN